MAFTTTPLAGPAVLNPQSTPNQGQQSARDRAVAALLGNQTAPVNQNAISPEERGAITAPSETAPPRQETTSEAPKEAREPVSSQFAQLAKKEKALRAQSMELRRQRDAFKAEQDARTQQPAQPAFDPNKYLDKEDLKQNLWSRLSEMGVTYDEITQQVLNSPDQSSQELKQLKAQMEKEIKAVRDEQERSKQDAAENQKAAYNQAVEQIRSDVKRLVDTDSSFELIKATGSIGDVARLIEETFKTDKRLMSVEEASQEVEAYLTEEAIKLAKLSKIQKVMRPAPASPTVTKQPAPQQQGTRTLTNALGSTQRLSARERAIAEFNNKRV